MSADIKRPFPSRNSAGSCSKRQSADAAPNSSICHQFGVGKAVVRDEHTSLSAKPAHTAMGMTTNSSTARLAARDHTANKNKKRSLPAISPATTPASKKPKLVEPRLLSSRKTIYTFSTGFAFKSSSRNANQPYIDLGEEGKKERRDLLEALEEMVPAPVQSIDSLFRRQNQPAGLPRHPLDCSTTYLRNLKDMYNRFERGKTKRELKQEVFTALEWYAKKTTQNGSAKLAAEDIRAAEIQWAIKTAVDEDRQRRSFQSLVQKAAEKAGLCEKCELEFKKELGYEQRGNVEVAPEKS